jgi:hypothetical protein
MRFNGFKYGKDFLLVTSIPSGRTHALKQAIIRVAPTCTLWRHDMSRCCYFFRFNRLWRIADKQVCSDGA